MSLFATLPEAFLHFVWKTLHFDLEDLRTSKGDPIQILHQGTHNHGQGPDFLHARLRIGEVMWYGHVELHVQGGDWFRHGHHEDVQYNPTILHVVLTPGSRPALREDDSSIPELILNPRIPESLLKTYSTLQLSADQIPCASLIDAVDDIRKGQWLGRLTIERMQAKAARFQQVYVHGKADWEEVIWKGLAAHMGGPQNQDAFVQLAERVPYKILRRYATDIHLLEAFLFGGIGCLDSRSEQDDYVRQLSESWEYLKAKHQWTHTHPIPLKFGRIRPASFPTLRLAQLAQLLHHFHPLIQLLDRKGMIEFLSTPISVSDYWLTHYHFQQSTSPRPKQLGKAQKAVIIANVLVPIACLYHDAHGRENLGELIEEVLSSLPKENNKWTRGLEPHGFTNSNAFDSQGLIQLHKEYCNVKRCLDCHLGQHMLSS